MRRVGLRLPPPEWDKNYALLREYREMEGDCAVPPDTDFDGVKLGAWVQRQRVLRAKGRLNDDQRRRLDQVGFIWKVL